MKKCWFLMSHGGPKWPSWGSDDFLCLTGLKWAQIVKKQGPKLRKWIFFVKTDGGPIWPFRCLDFSFRAQRSFSEAPLMAITCVTLKQQLSWRVIKEIYGSNLQKEIPLAPCVWNIKFWKRFFVLDQYSRWYQFWSFVSHQRILKKYKRNCFRKNPIFVER